MHVVIKKNENHIGKKLSFFHSYREKTQFFPYKNSSTANHEMQKNRKHRKLQLNWMLSGMFQVVVIFLRRGQLLLGWSLIV